MRNYKSLLLILALVIGFSCKHDDPDPINACGVENPAENLPWLKTMIESLDTSSTYYTYLYISQGQYDGKTVFLFSNCCPFCDSTVPVYSCEGELLWYAPEHPDRIITDIKIVWKPVGFQCTL